MLTRQPIIFTATSEDVIDVFFCVKWFAAILSYKQGHLSIFPLDYESKSITNKEGFVCFKCYFLLKFE